MRILLTNDDGINADGLKVLEKIAAELSDDVWVVAPEMDQSGFAHSLSLSEPLRMRKVSERHYAVRGTPTDSVIMGVRQIMPQPPDLVLSGVNAGSNVADDVTYSGTVAGAMEGTLLGIRSIALSQVFTLTDQGRTIDWGPAAAHAAELVHKIAGADLPQGVFVNVNFPNCRAEDVDGWQVVTQGKRVHGLWLDEREDGRGVPYYWLRFGREKFQIHDGTDLAALRDNRISVTPLHLDLTAHEAKERLTKALG